MDGDRLALPARRGRRASRCCSASGADGPLFAVDLDAPAPGGDEPPPLIAAGGAARLARHARRRRPTGPRPVGLREAVAVLPQDEGGLVAYVAALLNWHRRHGFCAACGTPTEVGGGRARAHAARAAARSTTRARTRS